MDPPRCYIIPVSVPYSIVSKLCTNLQHQGIGCVAEGRLGQTKPQICVTLFMLNWPISHLDMDCLAMLPAREQEEVAAAALLELEAEVAETSLRLELETWLWEADAQLLSDTLEALTLWTIFLTMTSRSTSSEVVSFLRTQDSQFYWDGFQAVNFEVYASFWTYALIFMLQYHNM